MKKLSAIIAGLVAGILIGFTLPASAVTPVRDVETISAGAITFTQDYDYKVGELVQIDLFGLQPTDATATVSRILVEGDTAITTQTVATLTITGGAITYTNSTTLYIEDGDQITITGAGTNAGTAIITQDLYP